MRKGAFDSVSGKTKTKQTTKRFLRFLFDVKLSVLEIYNKH